LMSRRRVSMLNPAAVKSAADKHNRQQQQHDDDDDDDDDEPLDLVHDGVELPPVQRAFSSGASLSTADVVSTSLVKKKKMFVYHCFCAHYTHHTLHHTIIIDRQCRHRLKSMSQCSQSRCWRLCVAYATSEC
jgi:hypothetical protein